MDTFSLLIALFLKLNSLYGGLPTDYGTDYASIAAWLDRVTPVYQEMGLVEIGDVPLSEVDHPADVPEDVAVWVKGNDLGLFDLRLYYAKNTGNPLKVRAGAAHDYLHLQSMPYLGPRRSALKQIQYENVAELGAMAALAKMANRGDAEARAVLMHMLWERSIVSTIYQALAAGGVEEAERLLTSYNLDEATYTRFYRVIELWQKESKTSRTLNAMYYNGIFDKLFAAEDGIVTGIGTRSGTMDASELLTFIDRLTRRPPLPRLLGRHASEQTDRWAGCAQ